MHDPKMVEMVARAMREAWRGQENLRADTLDWPDIEDDTAPAWPDPVRPGAPMNPEKDGWHWIKCPDHGDVISWWDTEGWRVFSQFYFARSAAKKGLRYIGLCLTPQEVQAHIAAAWLTTREALTGEGAVEVFLQGFYGAEATFTGSLKAGFDRLRALPPPADAMAALKQEKADE